MSDPTHDISKTDYQRVVHHPPGELSFGLTEDEFMQLPLETRMRLAMFVSHACEKSYRRGLQQGAVFAERGTLNELQALEIRNRWPLYKAPWAGGSGRVEAAIARHSHEVGLYNVFGRDAVRAVTPELTRLLNIHNRLSDNP